jgi:hypothetical protein
MDIAVGIAQTARGEKGEQPWVPTMLVVGCSTPVLFLSRDIPVLFASGSASAKPVKRL